MDPRETERRTPHWQDPPGAEPFPPSLRDQLLAALHAKGEDYRPRTHHVLEGGRPRFVNRLVTDDSPYLLQHAHNPVNWFPWGSEAFEEARRLDRPVLLSVGYSTCHWCHVMEQESFEDEEVARTINERFVPVKVDREQRPDVDGIYMTAVQMMTGSGGWPMTLALTPDREPFFGGTYLPPRDGDRGARMGLLSVLVSLEHAWNTDRATVVEQAALVSREIRRHTTPAAPGDLPGIEVLLQAEGSLSASFDSMHGGFGGAPKFPQPSQLDLLLHAHRRTGDQQSLAMVTRTLQKMADGGIHDQLGGGFHRYATDARWIVPHFEKMLYDNAQLASLYLAAYQLTRDEALATVARSTLDYVIREMTAAEGGFYSATDADSAGPDGHMAEGLFFTWTPQEIDAALPPSEARLMKGYLGVTERGELDGRNVLHVARSVGAMAAAFETTEGAVRERIRRASKTLYDVRSRRPAPFRDTKVLASWNGLMVGALARGGLVLRDERYTLVAERAADFIEREMVHAGVLYRTWKDGKASHAGLLDDHANLASGLLDLFEATGASRYLRFALALVDTLEERFRDRDAGGYFLVGSGHEPLLTREKPFYDGAEPSGNAMAALVLVRLHALTEDDRYRRRAEETLRAFSGLLREHPTVMPRLVTALDHLVDRSKELAIVRPASGGDVEPFMAVLTETYLPDVALVVTTEGDPLEELAVRIPWLAGKRAQGGRVTAYVCEQGECQAPTTDPSELARALHNLTRPTHGEEGR